MSSCRVEDFCISPTAFSFSGCRCTRNWEETHPGQLTQNGQRDIPYYMMMFSNKTWCEEVECGRGVGGGRDVLNGGGMFSWKPCI